MKGRLSIQHRRIGRTRDRKRGLKCNIHLHFILQWKEHQMKIKERREPFFNEWTQSKIIFIFDEHISVPNMFSKSLKNVKNSAHCKN